MCIHRRRVAILKRLQDVNGPDVAQLTRQFLGVVPNPRESFERLGYHGPHQLWLLLCVALWGLFVAGLAIVAANAPQRQPVSSSSVYVLPPQLLSLSLIADDSAYPSCDLHKEALALMAIGVIGFFPLCCFALARLSEWAYFSVRRANARLDDEEDLVLASDFAEIMREKARVQACLSRWEALVRGMAALAALALFVVAAMLLAWAAGDRLQAPPDNSVDQGSYPDPYYPGGGGESGGGDDPESDEPEPDPDPDPEPEAQAMTSRSRSLSRRIGIRIRNETKLSSSDSSTSAPSFSLPPVQDGPYDYHRSSFSRPPLRPFNILLDAVWLNLSAQVQSAGWNVTACSADTLWADVVLPQAAGNATITPAATCLASTVAWCGAGSAACALRA